MNLQQPRSSGKTNINSQSIPISPLSARLKYARFSYSKHTTPPSFLPKIPISSLLQAQGESEILRLSHPSAANSAGVLTAGEPN
ncbi:hypothetical protein PCANC_03066 [Puccinia coronata f. sp. avenae]|uniref:Uncharacterized protein n=1 Tax=Puccinia coronata f. sp. avenae TaxID=200324 RepID=A0A2N5W4N5_9BASI|nr:hypothetical protein PCANC_03066 [Puccinia coronata f. sp. avenae]